MSAGKATIIDVFAGVGGLSLGAARAGFSVQAAVELDQKAVTTHALNFPATAHLNVDAGTLTGSSLLSQAGLRKGELTGLIGGPPCQGFSEMGRRDTSDPRNSLFAKFFHLVSETNPAFFLAENVPGLLAERNSETLKGALKKIPARYVVLPPMLIKASEWGAATTRTRVFFIGYDPDKCSQLSDADFVPLSDVEDVRVGRALAHLPALRSAWASEADSWRAVGALDTGKFEANLSGNVPEGVGDPLALQRYRSKKLVSGFLGTTHTPETIERFKALAPGGVDPVSKGKRLTKVGYCPTLRAGTGPDKGSYQAVRPIHPTSPRVICPREAARLQGFPDWFQFHPTKWHAFRQIGNSVSPIVAESVLKILKTATA